MGHFQSVIEYYLGELGNMACLLNLHHDSSCSISILNLKAPSINRQQHSLPKLSPATSSFSAHSLTKSLLSLFGTSLLLHLANQRLFILSGEQHSKLKIIREVRLHFLIL
jgi:hypothetical protein